MVDYKIAAIPTMYRGRQYRSRLEAKWGAFFDLCGWVYEYEPADLGAWSPDFAIRTVGHPILVEVKPVSDRETDIADKMAASARAADFKGTLLLLGTSPFSASSLPGRMAIGWLGYTYHPYPSGDVPIADWFDAVLCDNAGTIDVTSLTYPSSEITENYNTEIIEFSVSMGRPIWAAATNLVQWRAPAK